MPTTAQDTDSNVVAPALPTAPVDYQKGYLDRFNNILRLYFNQLDNALRNAVATAVPTIYELLKARLLGLRPCSNLALTLM